MSNDLSGSTIGKYQLQECTARSSKTEVYRANQPDLKREVAFKRLLPPLADNADVVNAFTRAVRSTVILQHLNIERVYEANTASNVVFKAMEFITGPTLSEVIHELSAQRLLLPLPVVAHILHQVCSGLTFANEQEQNPVHRGISAANIMIRVKGNVDDLRSFALNIGPSDVVLTDYAVAHVLNLAMQKLAPDTVPGLADYTAPELCAGKKGDNRSDVYSLGIVLYHLVTGMLPFPDSTPSVVMQKHMNEPPPPPRTFRPDLPPEVEELVLKAIAKNPADRFYDAEAFGLTLKQKLGQMNASLQLVPMSDSVPSGGSGGSVSQPASSAASETRLPSTAGSASLGDLRQEALAAEDEDEDEEEEDEAPPAKQKGKEKKPPREKKQKEKKQKPPAQEKKKQGPQTSRLKSRAVPDTFDDQELPREASWTPLLIFIILVLLAIASVLWAIVYVTG
jgi:serine/threonine-protein kinase